jgi:hypothetical protein
MSLDNKALNELLKRHPVPIGCAGLTLLLLLVLYFRFGGLAEVQASLEDREKALSKLVDNVKFSAQLDSQLAALEQANEVLQAGALRAGELARNQQLFYRLEADSGVKLLDIRQLPLPLTVKGASPTVYVPITFSLSMVGEYDQIMKFLKNLERGSTISRLVAATIGQPMEGGQTVSITVELLGLRS